MKGGAGPGCGAWPAGGSTPRHSGAGRGRPVGGVAEAGKPDHENCAQTRLAARKEPEIVGDPGGARRLPAPGSGSLCTLGCRPRPAESAPDRKGNWGRHSRRCGLSGSNAAATAGLRPGRTLMEAGRAARRRAVLSCAGTARARSSGRSGRPAGPGEPQTRRAAFGSRPREAGQNRPQCPGLLAMVPKSGAGPDAGVPAQIRLRSGRFDPMTQHPAGAGRAGPAEGTALPIQIRPATRQTFLIYEAVVRFASWPGRGDAGRAVAGRAVRGLQAGKSRRLRTCAGTKMEQYCFPVADDRAGMAVCCG